MKIHLITVGSPKLNFAQSGWQEYTKRLGHFHQLKITHLKDKDDNPSSLLAAAGSSFKVAMVIDSKQLSSEELAEFLTKRAETSQNVSFIIGGPEGLPEEVISSADLCLSLSKLTFPHDLAMVILAEALYRASSINAGLPYHRA